ncbi:MAG: DUF2840 domain-containing protein [Pseudomonadota bacterium]|jgi:hypothetical protein
MPAAPSSPWPNPDGLTEVDLVWYEGQLEHWLRFGRAAGERILDRRRRTLSFAPGAVFGFARWAANDYGTAYSKIAILRAVTPGEAYVTSPQVRPGAEILLSLSSWRRVRQALQAIDAVEALGLNPADAAPEHWRHVHNRIIAGFAPRPYTAARHHAWRLRQAVQP